jgi:WD40 repeat protein
VRVWDLWQAAAGGKAEAALLTDHQLPVSALAWHADAKTLASGSFDQTVRVADVETGRSVGVSYIPSSHDCHFITV